MDPKSLLPLSSSIQLPIIDFCDQTLTPGTSKWDNVKADVRKALEDYGCFEALFDKVSTELYKSVFEAMEEIFDLPSETKQRNVSKPFHGYLNHNLYESLAIDDANFATKVDDFTQQIWPGQGNKRISETMHVVSEQLVELDVMVRRMIMESFGVEKYIEEHLDSTNYLFRMIKYTTPPDCEETKLYTPSHTDKSFMTILHQFQVEGLEIKTKDEQWIKVRAPHHHCSYIVMVGDSMCAYLNGRLSPAYHRVMIPNKTRYSNAFFATPKVEVTIDSPEELIKEEHPRMFKPFVFSDFRDFYNTEAGYAAQSTLHAFGAL